MDVNAMRYNTLVILEKCHSLGKAYDVLTEFYNLFKHEMGTMKPVQLSKTVTVDLLLQEFGLNHVHE